MALKALLGTKVDVKLFKPPLLHIKVLKLVDTNRVTSWVFTDTSAKPAVITHNKTAIISDGHSTSEIILFEEFACKVKEGGSYIIRGHRLRGQVPPYSLSITKTTLFFRASELAVSDDLMAQATSMVNPPSPTIPLADLKGTTTLFSVEGVVMELSAMKRLYVRGNEVPMTRLTLKQDKRTATVCLWREAAVVALSIGQKIKISHLKTKGADRLNSTNFTKVESTLAQLAGLQI